MPSVSDFRLGNISPRYAPVFHKEKCVGILEQVDDESIGSGFIGGWFARYYPSHEDAHQRDRLSHAVVFSRTRKDCLREFAELMVRNSRR